MPVKVEFSDNDIIALLSGDIDHHSAVGLREEIDRLITEKSPKTLVMDFSQVGFMDSSGIGLVIGRFKSMQEVNGKIIVQNPPYHIKKVMKLAGIDKIAKITNNLE
ncbi:MAG TPA: anti-anti-sigma factor [Ruminococcus sp.]|nr:anti-anti-sigma factor [Ruminococcus sp.]HCR72907.1 anti-anti-sigma factor [Ruminococcus sp.]